MNLKKNILLALFILASQLVQAQCWNLVWEDEFTGTSLDGTNWSYQTGASGWGNNELQYYRNGTNNVTVSNGVLKITAKEESYMGADYTSARIRTINKSDWTHGKMEARIKLPEGQGIWPACWMLPTDNIFGGWPNSGEIDIMEYLGHQTNTAYGTIHYSLNGSHNFEGDNYVLPSGGYNDAFHTFTIEWESDEIRWYIDGVLYHSVTEASLGITPWVFDENFHFILNLAVGGDWPGSPDNTTVFPQTMEVDYLRVYQQLSEILVTGDNLVEPNEENVPYAVPSIAGATYNWTVPSGASIVSGQGTENIIVDWGQNSGDITVQLTTACGTESIVSPVEVTTNLFENPEFENGLVNWNHHANGAAADFSITTIAPQKGTKSAKVDVTVTGANPWDIQLQRGGISLQVGETYNLSFWAKSETAGLVFPVAFVKNQSPWTVYAFDTFTTSLGWQEYTLSFTPTVSDNVFFNIDLGSNLGVYYFDNFIFETNTALPVELGDFTVRQLDKAVSLEWVTYSEVNNNYFEIFRSSNGRDFNEIGKVSGIGNSTNTERYQFNDNAPYRGRNYYQLRQVDNNGTVTKSDIRSIDFEFSKIEIYPNPAIDKLMVKGFTGGVLRIVNLEGKVIFEDKFDSAEELNLDVSFLTAGVYFLRTDQIDLQFAK